MKKDYHTTKKLVIAGLVLLIILLVAGLVYLLNSMNRADVLESVPVETSESSQEVTVPEISLPEEESSSAVETETGETEPVSTEAEPLSTEADKEQLESKGQENTSAPVISNDTGNKPASKKEAEKPETKPEPANPGNVTNPEQPPQYETEAAPPQTKPEEPEGGTVNEEGKVYVPGFGYVDPPAPPHGEPAYSDGDWNKQVGDM